MTATMMETTKAPEVSAETLRRAWAEALAGPGPARARDVAAGLGVSEAALLAARVGDGVIRLSGDWKRLLSELHACRRLMGLTRNASAVIEKEGVYEPVSFQGPMGLVLDEGLDLRLFMSRWHHAFAVAHATPKGERWGLHFFDADGDAVHKVYLTEDSDKAEFWGIVDRYRATAQDAPLKLAAKAPKEADRPDAEIDVEGFRATWRALEDTHDFFGMLRRFGVGREQGLRLAPEGFAREVGVGALGEALERAAATALPIMIFVGSAGCIEIHGGPIERVKRLGPWLNVLDPGFNLHLREDHIARAWVVQKPTVDGVVTSLEIFDADGENIALMFGYRKPGIPEDTRWRMLADDLT